jgi:hypothetical protein
MKLTSGYSATRSLWGTWRFCIRSACCQKNFVNEGRMSLGRAKEAGFVPVKMPLREDDEERKEETEEDSL